MSVSSSQSPSRLRDDTLCFILEDILIDPLMTHTIRPFYLMSETDPLQAPRLTQQMPGPYPGIVPDTGPVLALTPGRGKERPVSDGRLAGRASSCVRS